MKIKILIFTILIYAFQGISQTIPSKQIINQLDKNLSQQMKGFFTNLDKSKIPSGIFYNKIIWYTDINLFDGRENISTLNAKSWKQLYYQIYRAHVQTPNMSELINIQKRIEEIVADGKTPIGLLDFRFHRFLEDAFERGLLKYENKQIYETKISNESPYKEQRVFAASALAQKTWSRTVEFIIDDELLFSNNQMNTKQFEIDFGNDEGYRLVQSGESIKIVYPSPGDKIIKVKTNSTVDILQSKFVITIEDFDESIQPDIWWENELAAYPYLNEFAEYDAYVFYGQGHSQIERPIIFAEGFDFDNALRWQELYEMLDRENFASKLREDGYDLIILNWRNPTDYIQRNSQALITLIERVLELKKGNEPIIVGGASMGGIVARYALALMESQNKNHQSRMFISFDSPHNGANIPLGVQEWVSFFSDYDATAKLFLEALNSIGAQQMLIYHRLSFPQQNSYRQDLINDLAQINSYPSARRLKKVAVSNGSGQGLAAPQLGYDAIPMEPHSKIIDWKYRNFLVDVDGDVWALPDQNEKKRIFEGRVDILGPDLDAKEVYVSGTEPLDNSPGGWRSTQEQIADVKPKTDILGSTVSLGNIKTDFPRHSFIPAVSALDLLNEVGKPLDIFTDFAEDSMMLSRTAFDDVFYAQSTINEEHVEITADNSTFLFKHIDFIDSVLNLENYYLRGPEPVFRASDLIRAASNFVAADSADVEFSAGNKVILGPGFQVNRGAHFYAHVDEIELERDDLAFGFDSLQRDEQILNSYQTQIIPNEFNLLPNFPNPFNPQTTITMHIAESGPVKLMVYDSRGLQVALLKNKNYEPGVYKVNWNAATLASGVYYIRLQAGNVTRTQKSILIK